MKKRKIKWKNIIIIGLMILCIIGLIISILNITLWKKDSDKTIKEIKEIQEVIEVQEKEDTEKTEIIEQVEEIPEFNPYWDYIKMNLIDVDFTELKKENSSVVGWIKVNGTNINYPFVHTTNNDFYLNHSFDKSYNEAGWVFLDYRNKKNELSKNNIIYAHGRFDNTMFGTLRKITTNGWVKNTNNHVIKISTEKENTLWQVFSIYRIPNTNDYIQVEFKNNKEFLNFANMLIKRSSHDFKTTVNENDKILTLSTCYNDDEKMVVHAKLIKKEQK